MEFFSRWSEVIITEFRFFIDYWYVWLIIIILLIGIAWVTGK